MNFSWDRNDPQVLQAFLYDLICKVKRPEEIELLVEHPTTFQYAPINPSSCYPDRPPCNP